MEAVVRWSPDGTESPANVRGREDTLFLYYVVAMGRRQVVMEAAGKEGQGERWLAECCGCG